MQNKKWIVLLTAAGLVGTSAAVGAAGLIEKVTGHLRKDVKVIVNGETTSLTPVYINGQAYVPVRGAAAEMGYEVNYDRQNKEIELNGGPAEADFMRGTGVIVDVKQTDNGQYRIEWLGRGDNGWVILFADSTTVMTDNAGQPLPLSALKAGLQITVEYGPVMALSFPGQSHVAHIAVDSERLVKEDIIQSVKHTDDGWQVQFGETKDGQTVTTLTLNAGKETTLLTSQGESVQWESLKAGMKVRAYYGPAMTKSIPPQSPLFFLVVPQSNEGPVGGKMTPEAAQAYRDLAWAQIGDGKTHVTTKPDDALVQIVAAKDAPILPQTDEQKKRFEELKASGGNLVTVTYNTDQDALLGPLTVAFDFETKAFVGYYIRK